jgi:hypothetical protein
MHSHATGVSTTGEPVEGGVDCGVALWFLLRRPRLQPCGVPRGRGVAYWLEAEQPGGRRYEPTTDICVHEMMRGHGAHGDRPWVDGFCEDN